MKVRTSAMQNILQAPRGWRKARDSSSANSGGEPLGLGKAQQLRGQVGLRQQAAAQGLHSAGPGRSVGGPAQRWHAVSCCRTRRAIPGPRATGWLFACAVLVADS